MSGFYAIKHLTFTFMSDFTYNRVGYVDVDIDDLDALGLGETISLTAEERGKLDRADALQAEHGIKGLVLGVDHAATRILAGDREHALLEYLTDGAVLLLGRLQHPRDELVDQRDPAPRHRRRQEVAGAGVHRQQHARRS